MTESLQTAEVEMRLPNFALDSPIPPFEWIAPDGRPMQLELRKNEAGRWSLSGRFEWYEPPRDARGPFIQVADDLAAVLTVRLGAIVERVGNPSIELGDGRTMAGPFAYRLRLPVREPSADDWVRLTQSDAKHPLSPLARDLLARYRQSLDHGPYVLSDANYCLTRLQGLAPAGKGSTRRRTAEYFRIDRAILDTVGNLAANRGDNLSARKAPKAPLSDSELRWMRAALRQIVLHVAFAGPEDWLSVDDLAEPDAAADPQTR